MDFYDLFNSQQAKCILRKDHIVLNEQNLRGDFLSIPLFLQITSLAAFAFMHSLIASLPFKKLLWRLLGERLHSIYLPTYSLFAVITAFPLVLLLLIFPGRRLYKIASPWRWLMIAGQALAIYATLRAFTDAPHRFSVKQQLLGPKGSHPLDIRGIYCFVRDPFLMAGLAQTWMLPIMSTNLLVIILLISVYLYLGSLHWERRLQSQFGREYNDYQMRVHRFIPLKGNTCKRTY
jgi:methanethiol S-methyltransferase